MSTPDPDPQLPSARAIRAAERRALAHESAHILQSLVVNFVIAVAKGVGAVISGSGSMLAETLHSFADCGNQGLLLLGVRRAHKAPDALHPLGYGAALYFWSFMVALLLFLGGGMFSIYEGVHKLQYPEPVGETGIAMAILAFSVVLESWALWSNIRELNAKRGRVRFFRYLREAKDSDLIVVFGENAAAVLGLVLAAVFMQLAVHTGDGRWDAIGSLAIGAVLVAVAIFLAVEVMGLLLGERAAPEVEEAVQQAAGGDPRILAVLRLITIQKGPREVLVACKLRIVDGLDTQTLVGVINAFEQRLHNHCPEVKWSFVEPDCED